MSVAGSWSRELPRPPAKPPASATARSHNGGRGGAEWRELKVQRGCDQAKGHLQRKAGDSFDGNLAVERGDAICHGKDRSHKRADEHGAHDGDVRIDIEADACDEHGNNQDA